ncbi:MAG: hypothetical protein AAF539_07760, partial [Planctomycetota bacterium]
MGPSRSDDRRRRRVLLHAATLDPSGFAAQSRSGAHRDSTAQAANYGTRVRQSLRGRWFQLVPMSGIALTQVSAALVLLVSLLIGMHAAAIRFPGVASRPELVAVMRLDLPGSLAAYLQSIVHLMTAGVCILIYQLRRYRNDDFHGGYRLWRIVASAAVFASLVTIVPMVSLCGALLEWGFGQRVALSGNDWVGLCVTLGGVMLALRLMTELWSSRIAMILMVIGCTFAAVPVLHQWNLWSTAPAMLVASALLLASTLWLLSCTLYLRQLYADVRGISPQTSWITRLREVSLARRPSSDATESSSSRVGKQKRQQTTPRSSKNATGDRSKPKRGFFFRRRAKAEESAGDQPKAAQSATKPKPQ